VALGQFLLEDFEVNAEVVNNFSVLCILGERHLCRLPEHLVLKGRVKLLIWKRRLLILILGLLNWIDRELIELVLKLGLHWRHAGLKGLKWGNKRRLILHLLSWLA
jgi:hypothetical protein